MMQPYSSEWLFADKFPKMPPEGAQSSEEQENAAPAKPKIIVVDDERTIVETLVEILNGEGFEAMAAGNGGAALELARTFKPEIVISDVVLPGLNGVEIGIQIREMLPECRIILFSGQAATVDLLKQARDRGNSFEILAKPVKPQDLLSILREPGSSMVR